MPYRAAISTFLVLLVFLVFFDKTFPRTLKRAGHCGCPSADVSARPLLV
jgi:hypothetical protein